MSRRKREVLQGTVDMLILQVLSNEDLHGWGISKRIQQSSKDILQINQGSLYPALYRLLERGWVRSKLGESEEGRPIKIYRLTSVGRRQLATERETWSQLSGAVNHVLDAG